MKKLVYLASIALFVFSCQKVEGPEKSNNTTFHLSFISDRPAFEDESRTAWDGSHVVWEEGNQMRAGFYNVTTGAWGKKAPSFKINSGDAPDGIFKPESDITGLVENNEYKFYSVYPNSSLVKENVWDESETQSVLVPSEQALSSVTFDPKSDVMVGRSTSNYTAVSFDKTDKGVTSTVEGIQKSSAVSLEWKRLVALSEITFKGLTLVSPAEKIQSVTMKAQEGAVLTGTISVDFTTGEYTPSETSSEVVCKGITSLSGNLTVWFSTLPFVANELTFEISTNLHTYTRKIGNLNLDFKRNYRNTLGVSMASEKVTIGDAEGAEIEWAKMDLSQISPDAEVIYIGQVDESYYALSNDKGTSAAPTAVEVEVENDKVTSIVNDNIVWKVSVNDDNSIKLTPKEKDEAWLYCINDNNGVRVGTNVNSSFGIDQSGYLKHFGTDRYIGVYNKQDWRCYTSTSTNISDQVFGFYVNTSTNVVKELIGIEVSGTPSEFWKGDAFNTSGITVTATWDDESETDVTSKCEFSGYDAATAGVQSITVSYLSEKATYNVEVKTISNTLETAYTATEAIKLIDAGNDLETEVYVKGTISSIVSPFNSKYGNISFNISEGEGDDAVDFQFYRNFKGANKKEWSSENDAPAVGDVVVGYGNLAKFGSTYEFAEGNYIVDIVRTEREATLSIEDITVEQGENITPNIITNVISEYIIEYSSDNEDVVIADGDELTCGYETGTATITATLVADGYTTAETTFSITVTGQNQGSGEDPGDDSKERDNNAKYTLTPTTGSNNSYAGNCDVAVDGITWNIVGNAQQIPWRLGGKSLKGVDRTVYSKTAYSKELWKVSLTVGGASSIFVNSLKLIYSTHADFSESKEIIGAFKENSTIDFEDEFPAGCYYKFVFNVTVSSTSNKFVEFSKVEFFGYK